ncbi:hypothetical protein [Nonlabens ponticola]|uniref:Sensor of ECF-type sigma factor n=1 Tax=Nonlabens ponticola TaxID=2496866 RepID=A0A3S9MZU0_9FLAO|nr:hypothetical protein [Nonlabens ponticola]AZQ44761.1 hypothetical protein EJ995_11145 [Nonlabens ponticola]
MKNSILIIVLALSTTAFSQVRNVSNIQKTEQAQEKIEALEVAYITNALNLTSDEAQKFWPLFNEVKEDREKLYRQKKRLMRELGSNYNTMSDEQAADYVDRMFEIESELNESNFESRYRKMIKVIGATRFLQLKKTEVEFKRKLLRELRGRKRSNTP